jgi:hypothetical protein
VSRLGLSALALGLHTASFFVSLSLSPSFRSADLSLPVVFFSTLSFFLSRIFYFTPKKHIFLTVPLIDRA